GAGRPRTRPQSRSLYTARARSGRGSHPRRRWRVPARGAGSYGLFGAAPGLTPLWILQGSQDLSPCLLSALGDQEQLTPRERGGPGLGHRTIDGQPAVSRAGRPAAKADLGAVIWPPLLPGDPLRALSGRLGAGT